MKMYEFSAAKYEDKIKKVYRARLDLRGIWEEDVSVRATAVGVWPNKSGYGFGWVDLLVPRAWNPQTRREAREEDIGFPTVIKRHYGLVRVVWEPEALEKEEYHERLRLVPGLSEEEVEEAYLVGTAAGLHLKETLQGDTPFEWKDGGFALDVARALAEAEDAEWMTDEEKEIAFITGEGVGEPAGILSQDDIRELKEEE